MSAAAVVAARRRKIVQAFLDKGADGPETAVSLSELGVRPGLLTNRLEGDGVLVRTDGDRYYLDRDALQRASKTRLQRALLLIGVATLAVALIWLRSLFF